MAEADCLMPTEELSYGSLEEPEPTPDQQQYPTDDALLGLRPVETIRFERHCLLSVGFLT